MRNIAFSGKMASGKDTMGLYFQQSFPNSIKLSFGGELKNETQQFINNIKKDNNYRPNDLDNDILYSQMKQIAINTDKTAYERSSEIRTLLQLYGTEYRRNQDPDYWVNKVKDIIKANPNQLYYITDARFLNEIQMLHDLNVFIVKLITNEQEQMKRIEIRDGLMPTKEQMKHASENEFELFKDYDYIVDNSNEESQETYFKILQHYRRTM